MLLQTLEALAALRHLTLDQLKCLFGSKWNEFMNASPERQAQMIGEIFGNIEAGILMEAGAARALGKLKSLRRADDVLGGIDRATPGTVPNPKLPPTQLHFGFARGDLSGKLTDWDVTKTGVLRWRTTGIPRNFDR